MKRLIPRLNGSKREYMAGVKILGSSPEIDEGRVKAYQHVTAYRNMIKAFKNLHIPVQIIHYVDGRHEGLYIVTRGDSREAALSKAQAIRNIVLTAFPDYEVELVGDGEISTIYRWRLRNGGRGEHYIRFESGGDLQLVKPRGLFKLPVQSRPGKATIRLGRLVDTGEDYVIPIDQLSSHIACIGSTGMGKTTTIATILNQLPRDTPYLVLDYHNEYASKLKNLDLVIRPGLGEAVLNPIKDEGDIEDSASIITDIFSEVYGFTHPQQYFFKTALEATYSRYHLVGEKEPNIRALISIIEQFPIKSYSEHETKAALLRRLKQLVAGQGAKIFGQGETIRIEDIVQRNTVIELGHIHEVNLRKIFGYILLKRLFNHQRLSGMKSLSHVTVLEEARYLIPARREYDPPTVAEKIMDEIRKFGEAIAIITQFPSQIAKAPLKNAGLVIIHRLTGWEDLTYIRNIVSMNEEQIEYVKQLGVGEALVKDSRNPLPFPVRIEPNA